MRAKPTLLNAGKIAWLAFHLSNALVLAVLCWKQRLRLGSEARRASPPPVEAVEAAPPPVIMGYSSTAVLNTDRPLTVACLALLRALLWTLTFWLPWARGRDPAIANVGWALSEAAVFSVVLFLFARAYDPGRELVECACAIVLLFAYTVMTLVAVKSVVAAWLVAPIALALALVVSAVRRLWRKSVVRVQPPYEPLAPSVGLPRLGGACAAVISLSCAVAAASAHSANDSEALALVAALGFALAQWPLFVQPDLYARNRHKSCQPPLSSKRTQVVILSTVHRGVQTAP